MSRQRECTRRSRMPAASASYATATSNTQRLLPESLDSFKPRLDRPAEDRLERLLLIPEGAVAPHRRRPLHRHHGAAAVAFGHRGGDDPLLLVPHGVGAPALLGRCEVAFRVALELHVERAHLGALAPGLLEDPRAGLRRHVGGHEAEQLRELIADERQPLLLGRGLGRLQRGRSAEEVQGASAHPQPTRALDELLAVHGFSLPGGRHSARRDVPACTSRAREGSTVPPDVREAVDHLGRRLSTSLPRVRSRGWNPGRIGCSGPTQARAMRRRTP